MLFFLLPQAFQMWERAASSTVWRASWPAMLVSRGASQSERFLHHIAYTGCCALLIMHTYRWCECWCHGPSAFLHAVILILTTVLRSMQEVHILKNVKLIDSPGIVASPSNPPVSMALRSLQVEEGAESVLEAVRTLLKQCDKIQVGIFPLQTHHIMLIEWLVWCVHCLFIVSGHASIQCTRFQKLSGVFNLICQKTRLSAEGWSPKHRAGGCRFPRWLDGVSVCFLKVEEGVAGAVHQCGNEDNVFLDFIMKTNNPTLIQTRRLDR